MAGDCTPSTCPVEGGFLEYAPSLEGNAVVLAAYAALVPATLGLGYRHKTPTFSLLLTAGLLLQVVGFSARVIMHQNVAGIAYFAVSMAGTLLGSAFILSALLSVLPHIVRLYGSGITRASPKRVAALSAFLMSIAAALELTGSVLLSLGRHPLVCPSAHRTGTLTTVTCRGLTWLPGRLDHHWWPLRPDSCHHLLPSHAHLDPVLPGRPRRAVRPQVLGCLPIGQVQAFLGWYDRHPRQVQATTKSLDMH